MPPEEFTTTVLTDLLARARAGDAAARDDLLRRAHGRLERLARKMLRGYPGVARWEETGDVLQNSLLRLTRALKSVTPATTREFFGLAAEQVRRELLDLARRHAGANGWGRRHRSGFHAPDGPGLDPADAAPGPDELARWADFHEAVARLPAEEREAFMLDYYHGWSQAQVAELFGVDERTVRRRQRRAAESLHAALGGELPGAGREDS